MAKRYFIITGGTTVTVAPHFSLGAPAYGRVGAAIAEQLSAVLSEDCEVVHVRTRMALGDRAPSDDERALFADAGLHRLETNGDLSRLLDHLVGDPATRCIVLAAAVCDWEPITLTGADRKVEVFGRDVPRLRSRGGDISLRLRASDKLVKKIRRDRKDIFLVAFKALAGVSERELYAAGLGLLKGVSANLVLANDIRQHQNLVITPEEYPYAAASREEAIDTLCGMIRDRTRLTFVRTVVREEAPADPRALHDAGAIPGNFVPVLEHLIARGAYKPFLGKTSGHFGCQVLDRSLAFRRISSIRKVDHNAALETGMAKVYGLVDGRIQAGGGKPSVGEHTQHGIYEALGDAVHSIVHFHSPMREGATVPRAPQRAFECGSVQCGENTSRNIARVADGIFAVHLDAHGPNIAFHRDIAAADVIAYIEGHFDLDDKTGGLIPDSRS